MEETRYFKNCPICDKIIYYSHRGDLNRSIKNNSKCQKCMLTIRNKTNINSKRENNPMWKGHKDIPFNWFSQYFLRRNNNKC